MDQDFYNNLYQQRQANQLGDPADPTSDAARFDRQVQSGAYAPFEQARVQTQPPPASAPAPTMRPQQALPENADVPGMRPQQALPEQPQEGTVPRGVPYRDTYRDFATGWADRLGLDPLKPQDMGDPTSLRDFASGTHSEFTDRLLSTLQNAPGRIAADPVRALTHGAAYALPAFGSMEGSAVEGDYGRAAGDRTAFATNAALAALLAGSTGINVLGRMPPTVRWLSGYELLRHLFSTTPKPSAQNTYGPSQAPNPNSSPYP
jgi:hypothetical protein